MTWDGIAWIFYVIYITVGVWIGDAGACYEGRVYGWVMIMGTLVNEKIEGGWQ